MKQRSSLVNDHLYQTFPPLQRHVQDPHLQSESVPTTNEDLIHNVEVVEKLGTSDHQKINFEVTFNKVTKTYHIFNLQISVIFALLSTDKL